MQHKTTLAKLLATENITVQYGNYQTAWFDIKNRVLGLPLWKDMGKDVTDLLIGHEVGHALFTPYEGWHDSPEKLEGCPRSYINVIEDARIERHIKSKYVGLVAPMERGYSKLFQDKFFGDLDNVVWDEVKLIDKINLKAKIGSHINVPFNDEEIVFFNRAMTTQTFEDVTKLVKDILAYTQENQPELIQKPEPQVQENEEDFEKSSEDPTGNMGHDDYQENEEETNESRKENKESETDEERNDDSSTNSPESNSEAGESEKADAESGLTTPEEADTAITDDNFRRQEHKLLDSDEHGEQILVGNEMSKSVRDKVVIPYKTLAVERKAAMLDYQMDDFDSYKDDWTSEYKKIKKSVNFAVKEFEMRKAAYRYTRAQTARTGSIDVNRLWSYKTNDDIFSRVTKLADAKNHGMIMVIDYSGSMANTMSQVMDQLLHLVIFCKAVNIPFDVYAFTSCNSNLSTDGYGDSSIVKLQDSEVDHSGLSMPQLTSSSLKKVDFEESLYHMFVRRELSKEEWSYQERMILSKNEDYGSTPLNQALIMTHHLVPAFIKKHNVDKMNLITISDGDSNGMYLNKDKEIDVERTKTGYGSTKINIQGKILDVPSGRTNGTKALLDSLAQRYGVNNIGFFIADGAHNFRDKIAAGIGEHWLTEEDKKKYQREYNKNKCVTLDDALGYNQYYIVKRGKNLTAQDDGFEPNEDASKGQIAQQFKKFSKSKKTNKVLLTNFGKAVA